ncbi:MAG: hypothetical protein R3E63_08725 [Pseudomonadales bacterium]
MNPSLNNDHGSLETAITGQYDFTISEVLSEAWERIDGYKWQYAVIASVYFVIYFAAAIAIGLLFYEKPTQMEAAMQLVGVTLIPMSAALTMMGLSMATAQPITVKQLFSYYDKLFLLIGLQILIGLAVVLGLVLLIIPGVYLMIALMFAIPLMLEKNLSIIDAFEASRKAVTHHWFKIFGVLLVMGIILFLSILPLGIGLIWTVPMMVTVIGVMYRRMFGIGEQMNAIEHQSTQYM